MQITHIVPPTKLFSNYVYFSSFSDQLLKHASNAAQQYIKEKNLNEASFVVEVASNDGYLLKNFVAAQVPCIGFEPASNIAAKARDNGIPTLNEFFGTQTARTLAENRGKADLILGNNVFAHAPDINDFVAGLNVLLKPDGWIILEFPYGVEMVENVEFDTIYHEHVFYFTLAPLKRLFARQGLCIFHIERLKIHGGSLRIYISHQGVEPVRTTVSDLEALEISKGIESISFYQDFRRAVEMAKVDMLTFLATQNAANKRIGAYGASAKGSTLLNFIGQPAKQIEFIADRSVYKHGKLSPGLHLPIIPPEELALRRPDFALLLVWNFASEVIAQQQAYLRAGGSFVVPIPRIHIA